MTSEYPAKKDLLLLKRARYVPLLLMPLMFFEVFWFTPPSTLVICLVVYFLLITDFYSRQIEKAGDEIRHLRESLDSINNR